MNLNSFSLRYFAPLSMTDLLIYKHNSSPRERLGEGLIEKRKTLSRNFDISSKTISLNLKVRSLTRFSFASPVRLVSSLGESKFCVPRGGKQINVTNLSIYQLIDLSTYLILLPKDKPAGRGNTTFSKSGSASIASKNVCTFAA